MYFRPNKYGLRTGNTLKFNPYIRGVKIDKFLVISPFIEYSFNKRKNWEICRIVIKNLKIFKQKVGENWYEKYSRMQRVFKRARFTNTYPNIRYTQIPDTKRNKVIEPEDYVHDVIYRYDNYRLGRTVNETSYYACYKDGVKRSQFLQGYNANTKQFVMIGKYVQLTSRGLNNFNTSLNDNPEVFKNYPIFVDVHNSEMDLRQHKSRTEIRINKHAKMKVKIYRRQILQDWIRSSLIDI